MIKVCMYLSVRKIWLAVEPVDMRMGLNGLSQLVQNHLGHAIGSQCAYVFGNRSRTRLKVLLWDGTGVWVCQRMLHSGRFTWPSGDDPVFELQKQEWDWLILGMDWLRWRAVPNPDWRI